MSQTTEAVGWLGKGTTRNPRNRRHRLPKLVLQQVQVVDAESESATMEVAEGTGWLVRAHGSWSPFLDVGGGWAWFDGGRCRLGWWWRVVCGWLASSSLVFVWGRA